MGEWTRRAVLATALAGLSCGGGDVASPPSTGRLTITTTTSGPEPDADGYAVIINDGAETAIPASGTVQRDNVEPGNHTIRLTGIAANCTVAGENPRSVSVAAGETARLDFTITCAALPPTTGTLQVTTATTGDEPDPDGYTLSVDNASGQSIGSNASVTIGELAPGSHTVRLTGLASNCHVVGDNPASVIVVAGAEAAVAFGVDCPSPTLRWQVVFSEPDWTVFGIWGTAATDMYALVTPYRTSVSVMLHYNGQTWSTVTDTQADLPIDPNGIWGSAANDVLLVGGYNRDAAAVRYDGHAWSQVTRLGVGDPDGAEGYPTAFLNSAWGTSSSDVFAVGGVSSKDYVTQVVLHQPLAAHYDGTSWSRMTLPSNGQWLMDVSGVSAHDVYAVGVSPDRPSFGGSRILHYDGVQWADLPIDYPGDFSLIGVWASSPTDVFAVGSVISTKTGAILHYDGHSWSLMAGPPTAALSDVWGTSGSNVYAVGAGGILHYDGKAWTKVSNQGGGEIWGNSSRDVFVLGSGANAGSILHGTP